MFALANEAIERYAKYSMMSTSEYSVSKIIPSVTTGGFQVNLYIYIYIYIGNVFRRTASRGGDVIHSPKGD